MRDLVRLSALVALACLSISGEAGDWPRFRGPNGSAVSDATGLPTSWGESENIAWKSEMPGPGSSSPIVSGDRIFVTCYSGYGVDRANPGDPSKLVRDLICLAAKDGKVLWRQSIPAAPQEDPYRGMLTEHGYASSTPATDGERVYAFFGKSGVVAFDLDGKKIWQTGVGTNSAIMGWGSGTSLLLHKDLVIVNANAESESVVALDKKTGKQVWKTDAKGYNGSWSTPILVDVKGGQDLVLLQPGEIWGMDPNDGALIWYCGVRGGANASLVAKDDVVFAIGGGPGGAGATAVRAGGEGDVAATQVVWKKDLGSYVPSPVVAGDYLFWADDRGVAYCLKSADGELVYRERLPNAGGIYASAMAADGKIYVVTRRNGTFVLPAEPEFKVLAHNEIESDETDFNASPAVADGKLILRSNKFLYCIGGGAAK